MFSQKELSSIDKTKYTILSISAYIIELKSNISGDYWMIREASLDLKRTSIVVMHKHNYSDTYHVQKRVHPKNLSEALESIEAHDKYRAGKKSKG